MNEDREERYVILNNEGEIAIVELRSATAASEALDSLNADTNRVQWPYTAHRIDPVPTVFETRAEIAARRLADLERLVDWISAKNIGTKNHAPVIALARELRDSRPKEEQ